MAIIDIHKGYKPKTSGVIDNFRNGIGNNYMSYGISYYPFLETTIVDFSNVTYANVDQSDDNIALVDIFPGNQAISNIASISEDLTNVEQLTIPAPFNFAETPSSIPSNIAADSTSYQDWVSALDAAPPMNPENFASTLKWQLNVIYSMAFTLTKLGADKMLPYPTVTIKSQDLINGIESMMKPSGHTASLLYELAPYDAYFTSDTGTGLGVMNEDNLSEACSTVAGSTAPSISTENPYPLKATTAAAQFGIINAKIQTVFNEMHSAISQVASLAKTILSQYNSSFEHSNADYKKLMEAIAKKASQLPPGPAMAGVMTLVDNSRGVWTSPANININSVTQPTVLINDEEQVDLNVDVIAGKSINAIRSFPGRGAAIIWGARTLDGNSLDWRYISVRRTMLMIEQSVSDAACQFVFAPNDTSTWETVENVISSFLHSLWREGALQGASAADSYSVSVGLGKTMTAEDILNGMMRIEIRVAIVHPAEFMVITYEQEMAQS